MKCLIAKGAGFIDSQLAKRMIKQSNDVRSLDNLTPQVHSFLILEEYIPSHGAELVFGEISGIVTMAQALFGVEVAFQLATRGWCLGLR